MMRTLTLTLTCCAFLAASSLAFGETITLTPPGPDDLYDLPHNMWFRWEMDVQALSGKVVTGATLHFNNIRNSANEENYLYITLLDDVDPSLDPDEAQVLWGYDNQSAFIDEFAGEGTPLHTYSLTTTPVDLAYSFSASELNALNDYLAPDPNFAIGLDPDCHFYNCGVSLELAYEDQTPPAPPIPEPATLATLALGAGAVGLRWRRRRKIA